MEDGMDTGKRLGLTRREFGSLALAGIPLALSARLDAAGGVRIGVQSYSFRTMSLDEAIAAMKSIGIAECELFAGHVELRPPRPPRPPAETPAAAPAAQGQAPAGPPAMRPRGNPAWREAQRKWRLTTPLGHFTDIKQKFDAAGVKIQSYNLSFNESFTDEEIDRGFEMAKALGAGFITASATLKSAARVAPFADRHKFVVAMHNHANVKDPNEFATPESFAAAMAMSKYFAINLDIGHFTAANYDPVAYLEEHHARITNLHLKDRKKDQGANLPWGEGDTPIKAVLQVLKTKKYDIPANIEYEYKGADTVAEVRRCFEYAKAALA
jgi:sugar phosphate isomerase/epimerase